MPLSDGFSWFRENFPKKLACLRGAGCSRSFLNPK